MYTSPSPRAHLYPSPPFCLLCGPVLCLYRGFVRFGATLLFLQTLFSTEKTLSLLLENSNPSSSFKYDLFCLLLLPPEGLRKPADLCKEGMGRGLGKEKKKKFQKCEREKDFLEKWNLGKYPVFTSAHTENLILETRDQCASGLSFRKKIRKIFIKIFVSSLKRN